MRFLLILVSFLVVISNDIQGQSTYTIAGRVVDSAGVSLSGATTVIIDPVDSSMITYGIASEEGSFILPSIPYRSMTLQITYIGYGTFERQINPEAGKNMLNLGDVVLSRDNVLLKEVVVKAAHIPISIHGDTILYNADAFKIGSNDAVEDLLKKLPGLEVSPSGEIKAQGETVGKVLVDGKEFFGNDHRIATKNLPANIVDKVAVFDKKSDESQFSGINDGQEVKTINLQLKDDKKVGVFGKLSAGYGSQDRFMGKAQVNKFSPSMQLSFIGNANNINEVAFTNNGPQLAGGGGMIVVDGGQNPKSNQVSGRNKALSSGLNFNYDFSKLLRLRSSYLYKDLYNDLDETVNSSYLNPNQAFNSKEVNQSITKDAGHNLNFTVEVDKDTTWQARLTSRANLNLGRDELSAQINNSLTNGGILSSAFRNNESLSKQLEFTNDFSVRRRLGKAGRVLSIGGNWNLDQSASDQNLFTILKDSRAEMKLNQFQEEDIINDQKGMNARYSEPVGKGMTVSFSSAFAAQSQSFNKDFFDIQSSEKIPLPGLGGDSEKSFNSLRYGLAIQKAITEEISLNIGLNAQHSTLNFIQESRNIFQNNHFFNLLPNVSFNKNSLKGSYNLSYQSRVNQPEVYQMATIQDNSNPLFLFLGNQFLRPENIHSLNAYFHKYDSFYFRNHMAFANVEYVVDPIVNSRNSDENYVTTFKPVNGKYGLNANATYSYSAPSWIPKIKYNVEASLSYFNGSSYVNDLESVNERIMPVARLTLENRSKDNYDLSLTYQADYTLSKYAEESIRDVSFLNQRLRAHAEWYIHKDFTIGGDYLLRTYSLEEISTSNQLHYLNLFASFDFGKTKRWTIDIKANDLLNQGIGIERNATPLLISERSFSSLGRYGLLSLSYSLSDFKPKRMFIMR